jgi:rhodanese-related sulfurtransferase
MNKPIQYRQQVSILLLFFAALAWILPERSRSAHELKPSEMLREMADPGQFLSPDEAAWILVNEDTLYRFIDVRSTADFLSVHIPGAINIPFSELMNPDWAGYLAEPGRTKILYSNGTVLAAQAWMVCTQKGFGDFKVMDGGLNHWFDKVMESEFSGTRITAADNKIFETRYRARDYFKLMNSLPDSLKKAYLEVKRIQETELVGGCE